MIELWSHTQRPDWEKTSDGWHKVFSSGKELYEYLNVFYNYSIRVDTIGRLILYVKYPEHTWGEGKPSPVSGK